jgi:hypothetical protein
MQDQPYGTALSGDVLEDCRRLAVSGVFVATRASDSATRIRGAVRLLVALGELDHPARVEPSGAVLVALETLATLRVRSMARLAVDLAGEADRHERVDLDTLARQTRVRAAWAMNEGNRARRVLLAVRANGRAAE